MKGRLENEIKKEQTVKAMLNELPTVVTDYYYAMCENTEITTRVDYLRKLRNFYTFIGKPLEEAKSTDFARYMDSITRHEVNGSLVATSFSYRKTVHSALKSFYSYLEDENIIDRNPVRNRRPKGTDEVKRIRLTKDDVKSILSSVTDEEAKCDTDLYWIRRDRAILTLFASTGMRETALTEINVEDVDFQKKEITIIDKRHLTHTYRIQPNLERLLTEWLTGRRELLGNHETPALFISNHLDRISAKTVTRIVDKYSNAALGYHISPHKLRAAFCTILYDEVGDIEFVRDAVGHRSVEVTKRYIVKDGSVKAKASAIMDNLWA